ncbi:hypothetical protein AB0M11_39880 [Streptomyces sp. NPDC051987]|uniref:hypothetical protein n=1 Tax=Streptomyces sp. NPDC051987 TaxID=3155808 RepID=UPI0034362CF5
MFKGKGILAGVLTAGCMLITGLAAPGAHAASASDCDIVGDGSTGAGGSSCLFYHSDFNGAYFGDRYSINYQGYTFGGSGDGYGKPVRNNAASAWNNDTQCTLHIWVYPLHSSGNIQQSIAPLDEANLNSTLSNNEASQTWSGPGEC